MTILKTENQQPSFSVAQATWVPTPHEQKVMSGRKYLEGILQVDQIWDLLAKDYRDVIAVEAPHAYHPETFTYGELAQLINVASKAFSQLGLLRGDVVALFGENSPRWLIADQGLMRLGAADAVRGASTPVDELHYILEDSKSVGIIVQNSEIWQKLALSDEKRKQFQFIVQLEGETEPGVMSWETLIELGQSIEILQKQYIQKNLQDQSKNIATIIYTSGTTGRPKGVPLTHSNLLHQIKSLACVANPSPGSPVLSVLPIWHAYERSAEYYFFSCACSQSYTTIKYLKEDLPRVRPVVMATVPRLWEAIQTGFEDVIKKMPTLQRVLLQGALVNSSNYKAFLRKAKGIFSEDLTFFSRVLASCQVCVRWPVHYLSSKLLWPKVLRRLSGGQLKYPINGGGAIAPHVDSFFEGLGIELLVGYGLTETSPVVSCRRPWKNIRGTSGSPLPETEFRIVDPETGQSKMFRQKGRVLVRGPQVMGGYLRRPEATSKVLDSEGWFDTGDLGMLLPNGELVLTGRAKDTIVLSSGENIEPGPLEEALLASPLIEQVLLVGQDKKQLGALLVLRKDSLLNWAKEKGFALPEKLRDSPGNNLLRRMLKNEVNTLLGNRKGARNEEKVVAIALVSPFTIENGLLTQTLKQKRDAIVIRDANAIKSIYNRS